LGVVYKGQHKVFDLTSLTFQPAIEALYSGYGDDVARDSPFQKAANQLLTDPGSLAARRGRAFHGRAR